jgi:hypothetical protein
LLDKENKMKLSTRELATIAVFGALWGLVEISLGSVLKTLNIPLSGAVLGGIGLAIALAGRVFVPKRGATLFIGVIAMLLKLFSLGGVVIGPMLGILMEAVLAEVIASLFAQPSLLAFLLAGAVGGSWSLWQPLITSPLLYGRSFISTWQDLITRSASVLGLDASAVLVVLLIMAAIYLVIGGLGGILGWEVGEGLKARMSGEQVTVTS